MNRSGVFAEVVTGEEIGIEIPREDGTRKFRVILPPADIDPAVDRPVAERSLRMSRSELNRRREDHLIILVAMNGNVRPTEH